MLHLARPAILRSAPPAFLTLAFVALATPATAAVFYVGTGPTCDGHPSTIAGAMLAAAFNAGPDEIRLTATLTYADQTLDFVDWDPAAGGAGALVIAGGYADCNDTTPSGRTMIDGQAGTSLVTVRTSSRPSSVLTLRDVVLRGAEFRGAVVSDGGSLTLQNVLVTYNGGGVQVFPGGSLAADAVTEISEHDYHVNGGGIACSGAGSYVSFRGKLLRNVTSAGGGNLYVGSGCITELHGGALIEGRGGFGADWSALNGGGIYVDDGVLVAHGGASRVIVRDHAAIDYGGGLFATGTNAVVSLVNTAFLGNYARIHGGGIYAENGASVIMDRAQACPFIISCSQIAGNRATNQGLAVYADDAQIALSRTIVNDNGWPTESGFTATSVIWATNGAEIELDGTGLVGNRTTDVLTMNASAGVIGQYVTIARNSYTPDDIPTNSWAAVADGGHVALHSSILVDTKGINVSNGGTKSASCLLADTTNGLPAGSFALGIPQFINAAGGDFRQLSTSPGVDFCDESSVPWPGSEDIELQPRGLDHPDNPNGSPGIAGGLFDVGFDEVDPGPSVAIFADGFESGGTGAWSATVP
jgi:hypothetical protein